MNILILLSIITIILFASGLIVFIVGNSMWSKMCMRMSVLLFMLGIVSGSVLTWSFIDRSIERDINKCELDSVNKQQISGFVTKNDALCVELADGTVYELTDNSSNIIDSKVYVMVTSYSSTGFIPTDTKIRYNVTDSLYYDNVKLWTNVLLVDKETYDKIFAIKSTDLSNK